MKKIKKEKIIRGNQTGENRDCSKIVINLGESLYRCRYISSLDNNYCGQLNIQIILRIILF